MYHNVHWTMNRSIASVLLLLLVVSSGVVSESYTCASHFFTHSWACVLYSARSSVVQGSGSKGQVIKEVGCVLRCSSTVTGCGVKGIPPFLHLYSRRLTFIHAKLCLTDLRLTSLTKSVVRVCGQDDVYSRHMRPGTRAVDRFLHTDFLGAHGMSRLDTRQQWTSSLFSWMFMPNPFYPRHVPLTDWTFYRQINLHCHEAFHMKGGSCLFNRVLIPGLAIA